MALLAGLVSGPLAIRTSEGVAGVMRRAILAGVLPPGQALPERKLAEELAVSRTPVREALFTLQGEGLIELTPGRCARVRHVATAEIEQIVKLRRVLETHAARCAAEHRDATHLNQAEDALNAQRRLGAAGTAADQARTDLAFHEAITGASGSPLLVTVMRQVLAVTVAYRSAYKYTGARAARVCTQHAAILKAVRAGDPDAAETAMAEHLSESIRIVLERVGKSDGKAGLLNGGTVIAD